MTRDGPARTLPGPSLDLHRPDRAQSRPVWIGCFSTSAWDPDPALRLALERDFGVTATALTRRLTISTAGVVTVGIELFVPAMEAFDEGLPGSPRSDKDVDFVGLAGIAAIERALENEGRGGEAVLAMSRRAHFLELRIRPSRGRPFGRPFS